MAFAQELRRRARPLPGPGGTEVLTIAPVPLAEVARLFGLALREAEVRAIEERVLPERYLRNLGLFGWEGQRRLLESCVAVVGCGGLGGYVIEALARSGVGRLIVIDGDAFVPHNLNRQLLSSLATLGQAKAEAARQRVSLVNPAVEVRAHSVVGTAETLPELLRGAQVVVDALDTPRDRLILEDVAAAIGIPLVHGAIAGALGQVTTVFPGERTLTALYGGSETVERGAEALLGTPAMTPMLVAACQVGEVLKVLLNWGKPLRGRLLYLDLESGNVEQFALGQPGV